MDDQRPISAGEKVFFSSGTGSGIFCVICSFFWMFLILPILQVPVVLIFTKFDSLVQKCYQKLWLQGKNHQEAKAAMHEFANRTFQDEYLSRVLATDFPPKAYICLAGNMLSPYKISNSYNFQKWTRKKINVLNYLKKLWIFLTMMFWSTSLFQHSRTILICASKRVLSELTFKISILNT